mmetsp:Transcript_5797/g.21923  ORF Transcript_5797/g.21923 Transcript_5797/m.21923 type:complete len:93 (-) Transcript_5797:158-436(-)
MRVLWSEGKNDDTATNRWRKPQSPPREKTKIQKSSLHHKEEEDKKKRIILSGVQIYEIIVSHKQKAIKKNLSRKGEMIPEREREQEKAHFFR